MHVECQASDSLQKMLIQTKNAFIRAIPLPLFSTPLGLPGCILSRIWWAKMGFIPRVSFVRVFRLFGQSGGSQKGENLPVDGKNHLLSAILRTLSPTPNRRYLKQYYTSILRIFPQSEIELTLPSQAPEEEKEKKEKHLIPAFNAPRSASRCFRKFYLFRARSRDHRVGRDDINICRPTSTLCSSRARGFDGFWICNLKWYLLDFKQNNTIPNWLDI